MQKNTRPFLITLCLVFAVVVCHTQSSDAQALTTPTPDMDGNIYYTVITNDTCMAIQLKTGVDIATLRSLNNLDENCTLVPGTQLLLGKEIQPTSTAGPSPTPEPTVPTPTPFLGNAEVCFFLFEDVNGNGMSEEYEMGIGGGAVSLTKRDGIENFNGLTTGSENLCFTEVPEGDYNITMALPDEYNATTNMNYPLVVKPGDKTQVNFGAQKQSAFEDPALINENVSQRSPLMAIVGILLMISGVAIAVFFGIIKRRE